MCPGSLSALLQEGGSPGVTGSMGHQPSDTETRCTGFGLGARLVFHFFRPALRLGILNLFPAGPRSEPDNELECASHRLLSVDRVAVSS